MKPLSKTLRPAKKNIFTMTMAHWSKILALSLLFILILMPLFHDRNHIWSFTLSIIFGMIGSLLLSLLSFLYGLKIIHDGFYKHHGITLQRRNRNGRINWFFPGHGFILASVILFFTTLSLGIKSLINFY